MKKSFIYNYIKTYFWQSFGIILNLVSMVIVLPMITDNQVVFGIYSVCISLGIFLSYADLGFVKSSIKYAGECFARGEKNMEIKFHGFSAFVLFIFVLLFVFIFILFAYNPLWLIPDIQSSEHLDIAAKLLFIQAFSSLIIVPQRLVSGFCQVRIEEYVSQIVILVGAVLKILSVFYFFNDGKYEIVEYFLFTKVIDLLVVIITFFIIKKKYSIPISFLLGSFRFDKNIFYKTKKLAFSSIFVTFMWVLYYEMDLIVIGKFLGADSVAIFAVALTFSKFLRVLGSVIFNPFQNRFNHFVGIDDTEGLKKTLINIIQLSMPILVITICSIVLLSDKIIVSWVGLDYMSSSILLSLLSFNFIFSFISNPASGLYVSLEKITDLYKTSIIMTSVFWIGVFFSIKSLGVNSFAIFKLVSGFIVMLYFLKYIIEFLGISLISFLRITVFQMIFPVLIQIIFLIIIKDIIPNEKGFLNLIFVIIIGGVSALIGLITLFLGSSDYKKIISNNFNTIIKRS